MRSYKSVVCALILTASMLLSCGSRRQRSTEASQLQSQQRSELAVNHAEQYLRDTTLEEWELLLVDSVRHLDTDLLPRDKYNPVAMDHLPLEVLWFVARLAS